MHPYSSPNAPPSSQRSHNTDNHRPPLFLNPNNIEQHQLPPPHQQASSSIIPHSAGVPKTTQVQPPLPSLEGSPHQHPTLPLPHPFADEQQQQQQQQQQRDLTSMDANRQTKRTKKDRACDLCRRKKIRCDYSQAYPQLPCTSCKSYSKQCTFNEAARKRGPPKGYVEGLENRLRRMEEMLMNVASTGRLSPESFQDLIQDGTTTGNSNSAKDESSTTTRQTKKRTEKRQKLSPSSASSPPSSTASSSNNDHVMTTTTNDTTSNNNTTTVKSRPIGAAAAATDVYSYVGSSSGLHLLGKLFPESDFQSHSNNPSAFAEHDSDLMMKRRPSDTGSAGILPKFYQHDHEWKLPHKEVVDRLVELYFKKMNIYIPIVDESEFYQAYKKHGKQGGAKPGASAAGKGAGGGGKAEKDQEGNDDSLSVPLLIAICRASARLLDEDDWVVKKHNISRSDLFVQFADELLCETVDFMDPSIEKIQILLLSSCNARKWAAESADWLGISLAVKMAQDLGLHRSNTQLGLPTQKIEARKRLWWSAYVLDRWICATLGRPLTISDADCDVELPATYNGQYVFLRHFIKLSAILGDVLRILCSPRARAFSDKRRGMEEICRSLNRSLEQWEQSVPDQWKFSPAEMERIERKDLDVDLEIKLNLGAGQLRLAYYSVLLLLKRPFVATGESNEFEVPDECYDAIQSILNIVEVVQVKAMLSFSWSLTSYIMFQVLIVTLLLLRNHDQRIATNAEAAVERLANQYRRVEAYIPEPSVIPVLEMLARLVVDNTGDISNGSSNSSSSSTHGGVTSNTKKNSSDSYQHHHHYNDRPRQKPPPPLNDTNSSGVIQSPSSSGEEQQQQQQQQLGMPLWGASSGLDWQDLMDLLADSGYHALKGK